MREGSQMILQLVAKIHCKKPNIKGTPKTLNPKEALEETSKGTLRGNL